MNTRSTLIGLLVAIVLLLLNPIAASAQTVNDTISTGTAWLLNARYDQNMWAFKTPPDPEQTEFTVDDFTRTYLRDTFAATITLQALQIDAAEYAPTIDWVEYALPQLNEFVAQKILILNKSGRDIADTLTLLLGNRKSNGGFAGAKRYPSNNLDTALALQALKAVNYADQTIISGGINYILSAQITDGGWGFRQGEDSEVYYTALVLQTLSRFRTTYDLNTPITSAAAYLLTKQNPDGGFGSSPSTVYETALAVIALIESGQGSAQPLQNSINYLTTTQLANGSWNDDPYSTALALRAIASSKPNLSITSSDIIFSNPAPKTGDTITISAAIRNSGPAQADNVIVQFYDGDPTNGGILIGETIIASIPAFGSGPAAITWTIPSAAARTIFISIDPLNAIDELSEADNIASKNLTSATLPDLSITSADCDVFPPPLESFIMIGVFCEVRNLGETDATNVQIDFIMDGPGQNAIRLAGSNNIYTIPAGGSVSTIGVIAPEQASSGQRTIRVTVDPQNVIAESSKANNQAIKTFVIGADVDVYVSTISFSPANPKDGDIVTITSNVGNLALGSARNVVVRHYLGDPASGGTRIGSDIVIPLIGTYGSDTVTMQWNSAGHVGNNHIFVVIDPDDVIAEYNNWNNTAAKNIKVASTQGPDLSVSQLDLVITPMNAISGDDVTIAATIRNVGTKDAVNVPVAISITDVSTGERLFTSSQAIGFLIKGGSATLQTAWNTVGLSGAYTVTIEVDAENTIVELNEENNIANNTFTVTAVQGPDIVFGAIDRSGVISDTQTRTFSGNVVATIKNIGNRNTELPFIMTAFEDLNGNRVYDVGTDVILGQATHTGNLIAGSEEVVTLAVSGSVDFIDRQLFLYVDTNNNVTEIDESNNSSCLAIFTACRNSAVDAAVKSGASWLIDHQLNVDTQGTMKAWAGSPALYYNTLAVKAYYSTGKTSGTKYANVLNKLIRLQSPDGSWDESLSTTADAILSLLYAGIDPKSPLITNAVAWIKRVQNIDGSWGNAGGTGLALTAIMKSGENKSEPFIQKAVQWLKNNQNSDGSWSYYPGSTSTLNIYVGTSPIIGLALAVSPLDSSVLKGKNWYYSYRNSSEAIRIEWLKMMLEIAPSHSEIINVATALYYLQMADGGWTYATGGYSYSFSYITSNTLYLLGHLGFIGSKIDKGITWIENHLNPQYESFDNQRRIDTTALALNALHTANIGDSSNTNAIAKGRKAVVTDQHTNGSWSELFYEAGASRLPPTGEALFALKNYSSLLPTEQTAVNKAINFLIGAQLADGGWPYQKLSTPDPSNLSYSLPALLSLLQAGLTPTHSTVSKGLAYVDARRGTDGGFGGVETTARAAMIYKFAGINYQAKLAATIAWLKSTQNLDGGWGTTLGYTSTTGSTSWALIALSYAGESGIEVARGVSWLLAAQNADKGWGALMGVPVSYESTTAMAVWALSRVKYNLAFNLDLSTERQSYCPGDTVRISAVPDKPAEEISVTGAVMLQEGTSGQLAFSLADNTFSSEYVLPLTALPGTATIQTTGQATYGYGIATTSFIVRNCATLQPDLSVAEPGETLSDPLNSDIRSITATVRNIGSVDANNVTVNFYSRSPLAENLIASIIIPNISAYTGAQTVSTTLTISEDTVVYAVVDPSNALIEADESNNMVSIALTRMVPDLYVLSSDISIIPPAVSEGQSAVIAAIIHNSGNMGASDVTVSFYDGDPEQGGRLIGSVTKSWIDAGSTAYAEIVWNTFGQSGMNYIHVIADPLNAIREGNETNNSSFIPVDVTPPIKPDLAITGTDITFSSLNPEEGSPLTLTAMIRNLGIEAASVGVALYDGDPAAGGTLIDMKTIYQFIPFGNSAAMTFDIQTIGMPGNHKYHISLDPEHMIDEINEANNMAWNQVTIGATGLGLSITTDKAVYTANEDISATLHISNQRDAVRSGTIEVKLLSATGTVASSATISQPLTLGPLETQNLSFTLNTGSTLAGDFKVFSQFIEAGNAAARAELPVTIAADRQLSSAVTTDRTSYFPNQQAVLTASITSLSSNYIFENLRAAISIADSGGQSLYTAMQPVSVLMPGQLTEFRLYWDTTTNPPGPYAVTLEIRDAAGALISLSTTPLTISSELKPSRLLRGQISVDSQSILQGEPVNINYQVTNIGNLDLSHVDLNIKTVHIVQLSVYDTLTDQTALLKGVTYAHTQQLNTGNYSAKDYLVVLMANISGVEETLASTYFRVEGAPSAPSLNAPANASDVETTTPALSVNNASDPNDDSLTYEFELYSDNSLTTLIASSGTTDEGTATTSWQVPTTLQENAWYFWRARAFDGRLYGQWMTPSAFRVNVTNEPPGAPSQSSPSEGASVDTLQPLLTVNNATDPDSVNLTYNFKAALDPGFVTVVASQVGIFEGSGATSWQVNTHLQENTRYYWTAQADDWLIIGPWMPTASFFVNTANDAPSAPDIIAPEDGTAVASMDVLITALNSTDPDSSVLTYAFEADTVATFDSPDRLVSGSLPQGSGTTSWLAAGLRDNTWYYTRAKASDGQAESPWSPAIAFFVNTLNDMPTAPVLANPSSGAGVNSFTPTLSVHNATDIDNDVLTYEFEIYADASLTVLAGSIAGVQETALITSWIVPVSLAENSIYYWRARAFDGQLYGPWMQIATFMVNTANDAPTAPTLNSPAMGSSLSTLTPVLAINNATDPDSDSLTYDIEIYAGGLLVKSAAGVPQNTLGITSYIIPTPLSDNTTYQWRARAYDGDRYGAWMDMATFSIYLPSQNITSTIDFDPNTLNQKSKGNWVTVYIELPVGYNVANIDILSLRLNGTILAEPWPYAIGDYDHDGIPDLMVKFDRNAIINLLPNGDRVKVTVTGTVGATTFEGVDYIRVIH